MLTGRGLLSACGAAEYPQCDDVNVARRHHQIRVDVERQLSAVVIDGWQVATACAWSPVGADGVRLFPDLVVHRPLGPGGRLTTPPVLCVEVATGPAEHRSANAYARLGVDHYWQLDTAEEVVEVSVRVEEEYRLAETLPFTRVGEWIDFGVGIVRLSFPPALIGTS